MHTWPKNEPEEKARREERKKVKTKRKRQERRNQDQKRSGIQGQPISKKQSGAKNRSKFVSDVKYHKKHEERTPIYDLCISSL